MLSFEAAIVARRAPAAVVLGAMLAGCSNAPFVLDIPFEAADRSALIVLSRSRELDVFAVDASNREMTPVLRKVAGVSDDEPLTVTAIFYAETLDQLGLVAGRVDPPEPGEPSRGVPTEWRRAIESKIERASDTGWARVMALKDPLTTVRLPGTSPCRVFETPERHELAGEEFAIGLVDVGGDRAVAAVVPVTDGPTVLYPMSIDGPGRAVIVGELTAESMAVDARGQIWLAGGLHRTGTSTVFVGTLEDGFHPLPIARERFRSPFADLAAPPPHSNDARVMYGVDSSGHLEAYGESTWEDLGQVPTSFAFKNYWGRLVWNARDDLFVVQPDGLGIAHYRAGTITSDTIGVPLSSADNGDGIRSIEVVPGIGAFAGTGCGYLLARRDGDATWAEHTDPLVLNNAVWTIAPYRTGFLTGEYRGAVVQHYSPADTETSDGRCADEDQIARLGTETVVVGLVPVAGAVLALAAERPSAGQAMRVFTAVLRE